MAAIGSRDCCFFGRNSMRDCSTLFTDCGSRHVDENVTYFLPGSTFKSDLTFMVLYAWTGCFFFSFKSLTCRFLHHIYFMSNYSRRKYFMGLLSCFTGNNFPLFFYCNVSKLLREMYIYLILFCLPNLAKRCREDII